MHCYYGLTATNMDRLRQQSRSERGKIIMRTAWTGVFANVFIAAIKLGVGVLSQSVAVMSDAVNNITDVFSSVTTIVGYRLARRYPSRNHPLGFGRIEYLSGLLIGLVIIIAGAEFLAASIDRILHPCDTSFSLLQILLLSGTIVVKVFLSRYTIRQGHRAKSDALVASGKDAASDVLYSSVIVLSAIAMMLTDIRLDGYVGVLVSGVIIYIGVKSILEVIRKLIGIRPTARLGQDIVAEAKKFAPIQGGHDLILHDYGPGLQIGNMNLEFDKGVNLEAAYNAMQDAQEAILRKFGIYFVFGFYCVTPHNAEAHRIVLHLVRKMSGGVSVHALHYEKEQQFLRFDAVVDVSVTNCEAFRQQLLDKLRALFPGFTLHVTVEYDSISG